MRRPQARLRAIVAARARRAASLPRRLRDRAIVETDLRRTRRALAGRFPPARSEGPVALMASLTVWPYQLKVEAMLARALEREGYRPVFLVPEKGGIARRYLEAFGIRETVTLGRYVDDADGVEVRREAARLFEATRTPADLKGLEYRSAAIGRVMLSSVSRYLHQGSVDLDDPQTRLMIGDLLPAAIRSARASEALLDELAPDAVLFSERNYADEGPISDIALARGANVIQSIGALTDDALVFKRYTAETRGVHPRSLSDESWEAVLSMRWSEDREKALDEEFRRRYDGTWALSRRTQAWTRPFDRGELVRRLELDPAKRTAVVFSHVLWDANMFYGIDLFSDQAEWLVETVKAATANDAVNWVVKLHPANVWKLKRDAVRGELADLAILRERVGELPPHVKLLLPESEVSTWSLFGVTDVGLTIRGSIGWELPCLGIPALTAGTGFYSGRGFTADSSSREEYLARLRTVQDLAPLAPEQVDLARRHAYGLLCLRPTRFTSFRSIFLPLDEIGHPLDHNLEVLVDSLDGAADLQAFAAWAVRSGALDYLEPVPD